VRTMRNKLGEVLLKRITVRIIPSEECEPERIVQRAPANKGFTADGIEQILEAAEKYAEKRYPNADFRLVEIGPGAFNFIYAGERPSKGSQL
jgi:hypothetical protein